MLYRKTQQEKEEEEAVTANQPLEKRKTKAMKRMRKRKKKSKKERKTQLSVYPLCMKERDRYSMAANAYSFAYLHCATVWPFIGAGTVHFYHRLLGLTCTIELCCNRKSERPPTLIQDFFFIHFLFFSVTKCLVIETWGKE